MLFSPQKRKTTVEDGWLLLEEFTGLLSNGGAKRRKSRRSRKLLSRLDIN
jgi:hypothetical protein